VQLLVEAKMAKAIQVTIFDPTKMNFCRSYIRFKLTMVLMLGCKENKPFSVYSIALA